MRGIIFFSSVVFMSFISAVVVDKATMERGKKVYVKFCQPCHQVDGGGVPDMNPPLQKISRIAGSKTKLIRLILKGNDTHEELDGETYNNVMPPFAKQLTDQQIGDVLSFVRNSFGNKAAVVTVGDVKYVKARTKL
jgi:mono/diheme cytochrome c family protein